MGKIYDSARENPKIPNYFVLYGPLYLQESKKVTACDAIKFMWKSGWGELLYRWIDTQLRKVYEGYCY